MYVCDIEEAFYSATKDNRLAEGDVSLKLAMLWVLYGILLMKDRTTKKIDIKYIHLVDNLDEFNEYPWGRVAFDFLHNDIHSCKTIARRDRHKDKKGKHLYTHIDIYGFAYVVQLWAYEAMPCVASLCGGRKLGSVIPLMLRWRSSKFFRFEDLTRQCFPILECGDKIVERVR